VLIRVFALASSTCVAVKFRAALAVLFALAPVAAQAQGQESRPERILEFGAGYGAPNRFAGSVSYSTYRVRPDATVTTGLVLRGEIGRGGVSAGIGLRVPAYGPFGPEVLLTATRTFSPPRRAHGEATYIGVDVGYVTMARVSLGVAREIGGRHNTLFTWSVGVQIPYGFWRW
jgi:hypothetical protein